MLILGLFGLSSSGAVKKNPGMNQIERLDLSNIVVNDVFRSADSF